MGKDARGWRCKFAVVAPSTNTIVQPDHGNVGFDVLEWACGFG